MKKIRLIILLSFIGVIITPNFLKGQVVTDTEALLKFSKEMAIEYAEKRAHAEEYAKQHDLPIAFENDKGVFFELQYISDEGVPMYYKTDNRNAAKTISTDKVYSGGGAGLSLDGTGIVPREWDGGGVRRGHQEFTNRVTQVDNPSSTHWHSTHVAGTIMAAGVQSSAKGMAYNADLRAFDWNSDNSEMASEAAMGALMSNHSYGYATGWTWNGSWTWLGTPSISTQEDYKFGFYDYKAKNWDQIAADAPYYLIVKSAGNDRNEGPSGGAYPKDGPYDCIAHAGLSKNVLTVGAVNDIPGGYNGPNSVSMSSFSCWGPADDGRIKPDIVANGVGLYSATNSSNTSYTSSDGTSMSAPSATGSMALLQQHWEDLNGTGNYMTAATLKGLVIHTADEAGFNDGPDYKYGWGLMNTKNAALRITEDQTINVIDEHVLSEGETFELIITADGTEDVKVTICWTDLPGTPVTAQLDPLDPMLVNDLDVKVTSDRSTYFPWKLNRDLPSSAATNDSENNVDNIEVVFIEDAPAGEYTVTVDHDGVLSGGSQAFSIIVSGVTNTYLLPTVSAGDDIDVCENSSVLLDGSTANSSSVLWTTTGDGSFNDPTLLHANYTLGSNDLLGGSIDMKLTAYAILPSNDSISDDMVITILSLPVAIAGDDISICETGFAQLNGQAENQESILWSTLGDGTFDDATLLNAVYTPGIADVEGGQVELNLLAIASYPCLQDSLDAMFVNIIRAPKPNAGTDGETCGANGFQLNGMAEDYEGVEWSTSGDGVFDNSLVLDAIYTPGTNDVLEGNAMLYLTAIANQPCMVDSTDYMELTILEMPNINAGDNATMCESNTFQLDGVVENPLSIQWSTSGDGSFEDDVSLSTTYSPGIYDIEGGITTLTLTAYFDGSCEMGYDELELAISRNAVSNAGPNDSVCKDGAYTLVGEAEYQSSIEWTTDGDGAFADVSMLSTDYTPGANDIINGEVVLHLNVTSTEPCSEQVVSDMTLTVLGCDAIGENNVAGLGFTIIPNPADNKFVISAQDIVDKHISLRVISIDGNSVYQEDFNVDGSDFSTSISSSNYVAGVYIVVITTDSKVGTSRLIIKH